MSAASAVPPAEPLPSAVRAFAPPAAPLSATGPGLLRFFTAGSVDDGKSTLIGRLLYDSHALMEDHLQAIALASHRRGEALNLALITDGLRAEREQNITIDVAYRYFATPRRRFIIADTPGHAEYTRNMVTGASHASLALILLDASRGMTAQTRRHAFIASLLGIRHFLVAVNKMDLAGYSEAAFRAIAGAFSAYASKLEAADLVLVPVSALRGDNVVERSHNMPWYDGPTLLHHLENVNLAADANLQDFRFPVQYVIRHDGSRGLAGRIASGTIRPGEKVMALPSRQISTVRAITGPAGPLPEAGAGAAVRIELQDDLDVGRGNTLARAHNLPATASSLDAMLCWLDHAPLDPSRTYTLLQTTSSAAARVRQLYYRMDVDTLHRQPAATLAINEIGRALITTATPLCFDSFTRNPVTGAFVLVDPATHNTVAAGLIRGAAAAAPAPARLESAPIHIPRPEREARNHHRAGVLWLTGLPASGKSSLARALERRLFDAGHSTMLLDGDQLRHGLCDGLGFTPADRAENIRRATEVARLFCEHGELVICAFVSPFRRDRELARERIGPDRFLEIHLDCPLQECRRRDPKGLYADAAAGALPEMTGMAQPYEPPPAADFVANSQLHSPGELADHLIALLRSRSWLP